MSEKKIELIAQLLAKAESTTPEEAEALTQHAERLMLKYMIDQATVDARRAATGQAKEKIVQIHVDMAGSYRKSLMNLWVAVGRAMGNIEFLKGNDDGKSIRLYLVGFEGDVEQLRTLGTSLAVQAAVALRDWWRVNKDSYSGIRSYEQRESRSSFINGFGTGAARRLSESRVQVVSESSTGTELVLADRGQEVREYFSKLSTRKGRASKYSYDASANGAGYSAGQNAYTGGRSVSQGRGIAQ